MIPNDIRSAKVGRKKQVTRCARTLYSITQPCGDQAFPQNFRSVIVNGKEKYIKADDCTCTIFPDEKMSLLLPVRNHKSFQNWIP